MAEPPGCQGPRADRGYTRVACASWASTWATCGSAWRSPTRPRPSPPGLPTLERVGPAQGREGGGRRWCASTRWARSWSGCRAAWTAASGRRPRRCWPSCEDLRARSRVPVVAGTSASPRSMATQALIEGGSLAQEPQGRRSTRWRRSLILQSYLDYRKQSRLASDAPASRRPPAWPRCRPSGAEVRPRRAPPLAGRGRLRGCVRALAATRPQLADPRRRRRRPGALDRAARCERRRHRPAAPGPGPRPPSPGLPRPRAAARRERPASRPASTRSTGRCPSTRSSDKLVRGEVVRHEVTFPEGKNLDEIAEIAGRDRGIDGRCVPGRGPRPRPRSATSIPTPRTSRATSSPTPTTCPRTRAAAAALVGPAWSALPRRDRARAARRIAAAA